MDRKVTLIAVGLALLIYSYLRFFNGLYYLSLIPLISMLVAALAAAMLFFFAYHIENKKTKPKKSDIKINLYFVACIMLFFILIIFQVVGIAAIASVVGLYLLGKFAKNKEKRKLYALVAIGLIITTAATVAILATGLKFLGSDETVYNYYSAYLLIHGANPYTSSMQPALSMYGHSRTILLNGSYEYKYNYPALSILPVLPLPFLTPFNNLNFLYFEPYVVFLSLLASFIIYRKSNYNKNVLLLIVIWLFASYAAVVTIDQYLSVALLLLIAYLERKNTLLSAILLGLAASTIQLSWFAIPFFYILTLREQGKRKMLQSILMTIVVFLLVNSYFIILAPKALLSDVLTPLGTAKLIPSGPTLFIVLMDWYITGIWVSSIISIATLLMLMLLFYLYTSTLKPLMVIVPMFIFFLSWVNLQMYSFAFVPLMLLICYVERKDAPKDILKSKKYIAFAFIFLVVMSLFLVIYGHQLYDKQNTLQINSARVNANELANKTYSISSLIVNISNKANYGQNISFLVINTNSIQEKFLSSQKLGGIAPLSSENYDLNFTVNTANESSQIYIMGFNSKYIVVRKIPLKTLLNESLSNQ